MPLTIKIPGAELFDNDTQKFTDLPGTELVLEHSLISISKWESIWKKPYLDKSSKTNEELFSYIQCMCIKGNSDINIIKNITTNEYNKILAYIEDPMTASNVKRSKTLENDNYVTSELIYAWMVQYGIPPEYQKWHLNRLMMLINILSRMSEEAQGKKKSEAELIQDYRKINEINKKRFNTSG